jgi:hypothetical protein
MAGCDGLAGVTIVVEEKEEGEEEEEETVVDRLSFIMVVPLLSVRELSTALSCP